MPNPNTAIDQAALDAAAEEEAKSALAAEEAAKAKAAAKGKPKGAGKYKVKNTYIFVPKRPDKFQEKNPLDVAAFKVGEIITQADAVAAGVPTGKNLNTDGFEPSQDEWELWIKSGAIELLEGTDTD